MLLYIKINTIIPKLIVSQIVGGIKLKYLCLRYSLLQFCTIFIKFCSSDLCCSSRIESLRALSFTKVNLIQWVFPQTLPSDSYRTKKNSNKKLLISCKIQYNYGKVKEVAHKPLLVNIFNVKNRFSFSKSKISLQIFYFESAERSTLVNSFLRISLLQYNLIGTQQWDLKTNLIHITGLTWSSSIF